MLVAACKNSGYGFAFDLGSTLVFVAIPAVALMITLFISLKVGGKKDWNDTSTMKLHYGTGEDRVDFEVCLTQKEILQMAKLREQDPEKWKDNELELVKAVRNGINVGKPNENDNKDQNPELLTDNPIETDTTAEDPTAPKGLITNKKLADEIRTEKRTEGNLNQEKDSEKPHIFKMKRSVRIILAIVACIVLFILFSALTTILGLKHGGGAIVMIVFMGLMAFVWRSIVGKKTDEGPQNDNNDNLIIEENTDNGSKINADNNENDIAQEEIIGKELLTTDSEPTAHKGVEENDISVRNLLEEESSPQETIVVEESVENKKNTIQTDVKTTKKEHDNKLSKYLKLLLIVILSLGIMFGLGVLTSFVYIRYVYPSKAKADDEKLIQEASNNPSKAYEIAQEMFKRDESDHLSGYQDFLTGKHGVCNFDHLKTGKDAAQWYCQYCVASAENDISQSASIAKDMFLKHDGFCDELYDKTGIEILKYASEKGEVNAQFTLGCYYGGAEYNKNKDAGWNNYRTFDGNSIDHAKQAYWYLQAASQGHTSAMGNLGLSYMYGKGVAKDEKKGLEWIQNAAKLDNAYYQRVLGDFYRDGIKVEVGTHKVITGYYWDWDDDEYGNYGKHKHAKTKTVTDYKTILAPDIEQAQYWWKKAADNGDETAKERLQQIYE